ncbi:MAG TPA: S8 family serine peptidase [Thermoanaerobaculia bacterium]|nr:S8 family serine peptidase [Thermoanaerobaculia bacterium]
MAKKKSDAGAALQLSRELLEQLMLGTGRVRRFTQDTPVLPDVWLEYAKGPDDPTRRTGGGAGEDPFPAVKLLLTPYRENSTGDVRKALWERLGEQRKRPEWRRFGHDPKEPPRLVYNQSTVAATLHFEDLIRVVLPMTDWWARLVQRLDFSRLQLADVQKNLAVAVQDPEHPPLLGERRLPPDLLWMVRVVGALALVHRGEPLPASFTARGGVANATPADWAKLVAAIADLIRDLEPGPPDARIYSVSLNREAAPTVARSVLSIKADAARLLFNISCRGLAWAVIDSGIDAAHPAFRQRQDGKDGELYKAPFPVEDKKPANRTRVHATYDFSQIDLLLDPDSEDQPEALKKLKAKKAPGEAKELDRQLEELNDALRAGRTIDWKLIAELLRVPHEKGKYRPPANDHGTHVAGILAGDWRKGESNGALEDDLIGVCPDLRLYDLRVLDDEGRGDEFAVMAALQFVRYLNSTNDYTAVHGVNLSLSIPHDVSNFACGRTPVCDEAERVVSSGVVVVAAAGNQGYRRYDTPSGSVDMYNTISITDPANAELVITVGATHRYRPHTYGVSYFSSRGPTGDGRCKPDLVAPGEKITGPLPGGLFGLKDGTSMAAPHVSGAAALLMARHNELVGRPARIKQVLCATATDLGRERYFQGAGMLDVLRSLQSV